LIQTPHRFRTKRQLWSYSGFGIETHSSAEQRFINGELPWLRRQDAMKTAARENQSYECCSVPSLRNGRRKQSCSIGRAGRQENIRPGEKCFFLDSLYRTNRDLGITSFPFQTWKIFRWGWGCQGWSPHSPASKRSTV